MKVGILNFRERKTSLKHREVLLFCFAATGPCGSVVEHPLRDRDVVGLNRPMVPVATLLGAQHKASTGFSSPNKYRTNQNCNTYKKKSDNNQCLYSPEDRMEDCQSC